MRCGLFTEETANVKILCMSMKGRYQLNMERALWLSFYQSRLSKYLFFTGADIDSFFSIRGD
jgi:hypothetical protein